MITLINGFPQGPNGLIVPNGSIKLQLNVDATVIAAPGGFVAADIPVVFQFNALGQVQPNPPAVAAKIWSNEELNPQLSSVLLGTYYLVTFYDQNGAVLNATPMWWQFPESNGATVDISQMTPISTVGGNVIFYPTSFILSSGTVTSVAFVGDGTVLSVTPSAPVTTSGNISATLLTQSANLVLAGPTTGAAAAPAFRALVTADFPPITVAPAGATTNVQINLAGVTYADAGFRYDPSVSTVFIHGLLTFTGTTGSASIGVAAAAGSPNKLNLPITTGLSGQVLSTDGGNPQQLGWSTAAVDLPFGVDVGIANAYVVNPVPAVTAVLGQAFNWTTTHPNTLPSTINVSGTGVKNLLNPSGVALTTGDILSGVQYSAIFDGQEWVLGGFRTIPASPVALPGVVTLVSLDPASGFNGINGAPLILLAKNPPATRQPLLAFGNAAGTSSAFIGFDNDNVCVFGSINTRFAFLSGSNVEFFDSVDIFNNTSFGSDDLFIQPSLGGANKTSGTMLRILSGDGLAGISFDFRAHLTQIGHPVAGTATFSAGTTVSAVYATAFVSTPVVVICPVVPAGVTVTLTASSNTGFTLTASGATSISVNYVVIGNPN